MMNRFTGFPGFLFLYIFLETAASIDVVHAQQAAKHAFKQISVNEGLSHSDVISLAQDSNGLMWIGTNNGLNSYDGYRVITYKHDEKDKGSVSDNRILALSITSGGKVIAGTERGGLSVYDPASNLFSHVTFNAGNKPGQLKEQPRVTDILIAGNGLIWVATLNHGIFVYRLRVEGQMQQVLHLKPFLKDSLSSLQIYVIKQVAGKVMLGTNRGLAAVHGARELRLIPSASNPQEVECIYTSPSGIIWLGASGGLYQLHRKGNDYQFIKVAVNRSLGRVKSLFQQRNGKLWVGTYESGCYLLTSPQGKDALWKARDLFEHNKPEHSVGSFKRINCFFADKYGGLWVGTSGGGANYTNLNQKPFITLNNKPGNEHLIADNYISSVFTEGNVIWIGTRNGLSIYNKQTGVVPLPPGLEILNSGFDISVIHRDPKGILWFGTRNGGLFKATTDQRGKFLIRNFTKKNSVLPGNDVVSIVTDQLGRIWVGTYEDGLAIFSYDEMGMQLKHTSESLSIASNRITHIYRDPYFPFLWLSYRGAGLSRITPGKKGIEKIEHFRHSPSDTTSLSVNYVWPVLRCRDSSLWIGTIGGGLNRMIEDSSGHASFRHYTTANGLPNNDIEAMEEDGSGKLWLAGMGLCQFDPRAATVKAYDYHDGLQSNSFKVGASFRTPEGELFFGGINGLNYFIPGNIRDNQVGPDILFTGLKIFNENVHIDQVIGGNKILKQAISKTRQIILEYSQNDFTLSFAGIHFASPEKNRYKYKLEGYHTDWKYISATSVNFSNLDPGDYTFLLYAANADGIYNPKPASLLVRVLKPWWLSYWAISIYVLAFFILIIYSRREIQNRQKLKHELILANKDRELNQSKLDFFTNISHELRTPLTLIFGPLSELMENGGLPAPLKEKLWLMYRNTNRLLMLTNQLLTFRKMETSNMKLKASCKDIISFIREIFLVFKNKAIESDISYHFSTESPEVPVFFDHEKMELVFTNIISNAFKYTRQYGCIKVSIYCKGSPTRDAVYVSENDQDILKYNYLEIIIEDDGIGISHEDVERIFDSFYQAAQTNSLQTTGTGLGLAIAKGVIDLHHGFIRVESNLNKGSRFIIGLPFGNAHLKKEEIIEEDSYERPIDDFTAHLPQPAAVVRPDDPDKKASLSDPATTYQILLIEDNADVLSYLKNGFQDSYKVITAMNGKEGLQKVKDHLPDIIISDVMMPEMDGLELCKRIKASPETDFIPVILLTARSASVYEIEGIETGADDYITKPFNMRMLKAKVNNLLQGRAKVKDYYRKLIQLEPVVLNATNANEAFVRRLIENVEENIKDPEFNVKKLAYAMAMSQSSLYKRIKDVTGESIVQFVREVRIKRAAQLFREGDANISEVARLVGITDVKYFRQLFKQQFGTTPSEYIQSLNEF